jgi:predicted lactoylglutathione lyase
LGFETNGDFKSGESASFFFGKNNFVISFFTRQRLQETVNGNLTEPKNENEIIFSLSAESKEEVGKWYEKLKAIGGTVFSEPQKYD